MESTFFVTGNSTVQQKTLPLAVDGTYEERIRGASSGLSRWHAVAIGGKPEPKHARQAMRRGGHSRSTGPPHACRHAWFFFPPPPSIAAVEVEVTDVAGRGQHRTGKMGERERKTKRRHQRAPEQERECCFAKAFPPTPQPLLLSFLTLKKLRIHSLKANCNVIMDPIK